MQMNFSEIPWKQDQIVVDTKDYVVFRDKFPVTHGHILFVPRETEWKYLEKCYKAAYNWGYGWVEQGYCDSYNIGQNCGREAGQTVMYPHVHLIPRRKGDVKDPRGGVRHVIPEKGNYQKYKTNAEIQELTG